MGRQRFTLKDVISILSELANPVRFFFCIDDVINGLFGQTDAGIALMLYLIRKVANVAIDIDRVVRCTHGAVYLC